MAQQKKVVVHPTATAPSPSGAVSPSPQGNYARPSESDSTITNTTIVDESTFVGSPDDLEKGKPGIYQAEPHDNAVLRESEIEWHYLTFDTEVPQPAGHPPVELAPPNLKKFESPFLWSKTRKNFTTAIATYATALAAMASGAYNSASDAMQEKWHISQVVCEVGLTLFCVGFAIAPMFLAPFSEINGRRPLFIASGVLLVAASIGCGGTDSFAGMCVARFFAGVGGSTFSSIVGGVISDMYISEERNTPMSFFSAGALFGTGLGPLYTGFIAYNSLWRWVFYSQGIICGVAVAYMILFFPETRGGVLLSQKAKTLNNYYDKLEKEGFYGVYVPIDPAMPEKGTKAVRLRFKTKGDEERESLIKMISISVVRPFHFLLTEPVVFFFSLWAAFAWAVLYLQFGSIPLVFGTNHGFNTQQSGGVFAAICIGALLATALSIFQEKWFRKYHPQRASTPEGRLYFSCIESILLPAGLFWFGWTSFPGVPWIVPALGIACATMGIFSIYLAVFNFLADAYHKYASSALAAQSFCRNLLGGIFPLVTHALFNNLGYPEASSLLGGIGCLLTAVPWVLVLYGPQIRAKSKIASQIMSSSPDQE